MKGKAFEDWLSLFEDSAEEIWLKERPELKKVAIIYHCLNLEFSRVRSNIETQLSEFKTNLLELDKVKKKENNYPVTPIKLTQKCESQKENNSPNMDISTIFEIHKEGSPFTFNDSSSPDLFNFKKSFVSSASKINQVEIEKFDSSEDTIDQTLVESPKLNRDRPRVKRKLPSMSCNSKTTMSQETNTPKSSYVELEIFKTPGDSKRKLRNSDSIIECTPEVKVSSKKQKTLGKTNGKISKSRRNGNSQKNKGFSTLTQLFGSQRKEDKKGAPDLGTDFAFVSQLPVINDKTKKEKIEKEIAVSTSLSRQKQLASNTFVEDYDRFSQDKKPAEVNYKFVGPTVRGKERKKLDGWSCGDCKKFYDGMNLSPEQLKRVMNSCSKHRSKYVPEPDTPPGFWDLNTMSTQD